MSTQSLGRLVVQLALEMAQYKSDWNQAVRETAQGATRVETATKGMDAASGALKDTLVRQTGAFGETAAGAAKYAGAAQAATGASAAMVTGVGAAVIALGALGVAAYKGHQEQKQLNDALLLTGNYAGLVAGQLDDMAVRTAASIGGTVSASRQVLAGLVATGRFTAESLSEVGAAVQLVAQYSRQTNDQVLKHFAGMGDGVAKWAAKTNEAYHFLDIATYRYIKQLEEQGQKQAAMRVASEALSSHLGGDLTQNLGFLERAWHKLGATADWAWNAMKGVGREESMQERLEAASRALELARKRLADSRAGGAAMLGGGTAFELSNGSRDVQDKLDQQGIVQSDVAQARRLAAGRSERAQESERQIKLAEEWGKIAERNLTRQQQMNKELREARVAAEAAGASAVQLAQVEAEIRERHANKSRKPDGELKEARRIAEERQRLRIQEDKGIAEFFQHQEELARKAADTQIREQQKLAGAYEDSEQKAYAATIRKIQALEAEIEGNGKLRSEVETLTLARLEDMKAAMAAGGEDLESINARIEAQRTLISLYRNREAQEEQTKAAQAQQRDLQQIDSTARRVFAQVAAEGGNAFKAIGRAIKANVYDVLYQLTLRPYVISIATSFLGGGGLGGSVGSTLLGAAGSSMGGMGGMGMGGTGLGGMFGFPDAGDYSLSLGGFGQGMGATMHNGLFGGFGANMSNIGTLLEGGSYGAALGAAMPYLGIGVSLAQGRYGSAAGAAIGSVFGPIGMVVGGLLGGMLDGKGGGPKVDSGAGFGVAHIGDPTSANASIAAIEQAYANLVGIAGGINRGLQVGVLTSADPRGTAQTILDVDAGFNGAKFYDRQWRMRSVENVGRSKEELQAAMAEEVNRVLLGAMQHSDVSGAIGEWLRSLGDAARMAAKSVEEAVARLQKVSAEKKVLEDRWLDLTGTEQEKLARARQRELEGIDLLNRAQAVRIYALQDEIAAQMRARQVYAESAAELAELKRNVQGYVDRLNGTPAGMLPPEQQLANSKAQFAIQLAMAKAGDRNARQGIFGYADQLIAAQVGVSASGTDTAQTIAYVKHALAELPDLVTAEQMVASAVQDGTALLNATMQDLIARADANAAAQIAAINGQIGVENAAAQAQAAASAQAEVDALIAQANGSAGGNLFARIRARAAAVARLHELGVPGYADGGFHSGGYRVVGERGWELEHTGPGAIFNQQQLQEATGGKDTVAELRLMRKEVARLIAVITTYAQRDLANGGEIVRNTGSGAQRAQLEMAKAPA